MSKLTHHHQTTKVIDAKTQQNTLKTQVCTAGALQWLTKHRKNYREFASMRTSTYHLEDIGDALQGFTWQWLLHSCVLEP